MSLRIIAKLDVKPPYVVKPMLFEGLRKVGMPQVLCEKYYTQGADEILYIDIVASLYQREVLFGEVEKACSGIYVPLAVGGGVKSLDDFSNLFHHGADKVVINTEALTNNPGLIDEAAKHFGNQSVVVSIEAKRFDNRWECYTDGGKIRNGKNVLEWIKEVESRGAGEIVMQSVDHDGLQKGFDVELIGEASSSINIPLVAASGAGSLEDILKVAKEANPSGVALSSLLHFDITTVGEVKEFLRDNGVEVSL